MNKVLRRLRTFGVFFSMFGVTTAVTYFLMANKIKSSAPKKESPVVEQTFGDRLLAGIMEKKTLDIDANISIQKGGDSLKINLLGRIDHFDEMLDDVSKATLNASASINMNGTKFNADVDYEYGNIYLAIPEKAYFYMPTTNILDGIQMIPGETENVEAPSFFDNIDLNGFMKDLTSLKIEDGKEISGGRGLYYTLSLKQKGIDDPEHEPTAFDEITFHLLTDNDAENLIGLRTDTIMLGDAVISINISIEPNDKGIQHVETILPTVENPETIYSHIGDNEQYLSFAPAMKIFDSFGKIFVSDQFGVNVNFSLKDNQQDHNLIAADLRFDADTTNSDYALNIVVTDDHDNVHDPFFFAYTEKTLYAKFHEIAVKEPTEQIAALIDYAVDVVSNQYLDSIMETLSESTSSIDLGQIADIAANINDCIGRFTVTGDEAASQLNIKLNLEPFGITEVGEISVTLGYDETSLYGINYFAIDSNEMADFELHITLEFDAYQPVDIGNKENYTEITPIVVLAKGALKLFDQNEYHNKYRMNMTARFDDHDDSTQDLVLNDSFVQFDIDNMQGNGELHLVDSDNYHHDILADMEKATNFIFSYNDTMKGKFNSTTMIEMYELIQDIVNNPDDHFVELFGEIIEKLQTSPLIQGINGNYGLLLKYKYFSNLEIDAHHVSLDFSLSLLGFDDQKIRVTINTSLDEEATLETGEYVDCRIDSVHIDGFELMGKEIIADLTIDHYDDSQEAQAARLNPYDEYMDFSDIKVLLELGIRTSKFNYYHMTATLHINVTIIGIPIDKDFPVDIKIRNNRHHNSDGTIDGNVQIAVKFTDIPRIALVNNSKPSGADDWNGARVGNIYYQEGTWYIQRIDPCYSRKLVSIIPWEYEYTYFTDETIKVCSTKYFLDQILEILAGDIIGCGDTIMSLLTGNGGYKGDGYQIEYEKILQHFAYYEEAGRFYFDLNLNTLVGNDSLFSSSILNVYDGVSAEDGKTKIFSKVSFEATIALSIILKANLSLDLSLVDYSVELNSSNELTEMNAFIARNDLPAKLYLEGEAHN